jgi:phenylpropionate dioxygenase-like ring-hydroxylating dioxygenase large terminal subunit
MPARNLSMKVMSGWHAIAESRELDPRKPLGLRRFGEDWVLWRDAAGTPVAMQDRCPHRAKLSLGTVAGGQIRCPYHGIAFDGRGTCSFVPESGRAAPALRATTMPIQEANGFLWAWIGGGAPPAGVPPWFSDLGPPFVCTRQQETWPTHYSRWVENELDITHLPFVHARTIGRGQDPQLQSHFEFSADGIRIRLIFVPVAEDRTTIYVRTYHDFAASPVLRALVEPVLRWFNDRVLAEDRRVVLSQRSPAAADDPPEVLFRQDTAVHHFRSLVAGFVDARVVAAPATAALADAGQWTA